ncbi:MAG: Glycosyl transferase group 1 [Microgenomates group bacterium GW2011_GWC1_43_11]|nr:MAG: Glycosyl transferase group 1 [Microgenomates group bacterium GW2011_GWC1_43_11]
MRIAIDTSPFYGGHTNRGIGGYTKNLVKALETYESRHTYYLFHHREQIPRQTDVIHYPYFDPFFLTLPICSPKPTVVTVHDLIPIVYPAHFPKGLRGSIKWEIQKYSLKRKQRIITDSECSKRDIEKCIGVGKDDIDVIYLAPSLQKNILSKKFELIKKQYGIKNTYVLYVGDVNWNKNIPGLLKAFSSCIKDYPSFIQLVLVGKAFLDQSLIQTREIMAMISELGIAKQVIKTGYVDDEILVSLYIHAQALIQPSLYEGFGLPVLEAMSLGCPVVCSSSSSLSEIAGPSIMVDPNDYHSIADGMKRILLFTMDERNTLIQRGHTWMHTFSWQRTAKATLRSYEKVLGN